MDALAIKLMHQYEPVYWWYLSLHRYLLSRFKQREQTLRVLDLGCGSGFFLRLLRAKIPLQALGIDVATKGCVEESFEIRNGSMQSFLPQAESHSWDCILSIDSFYFLSEQEQIEALSHIHRILKPGGRFLLHCPSGELFRREHDQTVGIRKRVSKSELLQMLQKQSWQVQLRHRVSFLSLVIFIRKFFQCSLFQRARKNKREPESDLRPIPSWINQALCLFQKLEDLLPVGLPWGSSLYAEMQKPTSHCD